MVGAVRICGVTSPEMLRAVERNAPARQLRRLVLKLSLEDVDVVAVIFDRVVQVIVGEDDAERLD